MALEVHIATRPVVEVSVREGARAGPSAEPAAAPQPAPAALGAQLEQLSGLCHAISQRHRLAMPAGLVAERVRELAPLAAELLHDRTIEVCFLLDQHRALRFNSLRRQLRRISTRTLAARLVFLQERGLVQRETLEGDPPHIAYRLTPEGERLTSLLFPLLLLVGQPPAQPKPVPPGVPA